MFTSTKSVTQFYPFFSSRIGRAHRGRKAISLILSCFYECTKISVSDKKYALACKFFEYIFEPLLAKRNSLFYSIGFHKFISNMLYLHFRARDVYADDIFEDFEKLMRGLDSEGAATLFTPLALPNMSPILEDIKDFVSYNKDSILSEIEGLDGIGREKWILDLTTSSLFTVLRYWGEEFKQLRVFCDVSKPIEADMDILRVMINRHDKQYVELGGKRHPLTFNLAEAISLVDSKDFAGIQLADVIGAAYGFAFKNRQDRYASELLEYGEKIFSPGAIFPEFEKVDPKSFEAIRNAIVLRELTERSKHKIDLLDGMYDYLKLITEELSRELLPKMLI